ncbi:MAG: Hsp20/alpha crystallin family protein [Balneolaceae bacterium]
MSNFNLDIEKQLSKLGKDIQQLVGRVTPFPSEGGDFQPECDIIENPAQYKIIVDLPGLDKSQVKISLKNHVLTVSGDRELLLEEGEVLKRSERKQGSFVRSFALPEQVDTTSISAKFRNGVLHIELSKSGRDQDDDSQDIPIQ